jgi:hypothetical protein
MRPPRRADRLGIDLRTTSGVLFVPVVARGLTNLQETNNLVWTLVAISAAGAIVTFSFLFYALWRFRDPKVKGRRYG